jgi:hypothetical protein
MSVALTVSDSRGTGLKGTAEFTVEEHELNLVSTWPTRLTWDLSPPHADRVISDFVHRNLPLYVHAKVDQSGVLDGSLEMVPHAIGFFGSDKKKLTGKWNDVAMLLRLMWQKGTLRPRFRARGFRSAFRVQHVKRSQKPQN